MTAFLDEPDQVIEERQTSGGGAASQQVWSIAGENLLVLRDRDADGNGSLEERLYAVHRIQVNGIHRQMTTRPDPSVIAAPKGVHQISGVLACVAFDSAGSFTWQVVVANDRTFGASLGQMVFSEQSGSQSSLSPRSVHKY